MEEIELTEEQLEKLEAVYRLLLQKAEELKISPALLLGILQSWLELEPAAQE